MSQSNNGSFTVTVLENGPLEITGDVTLRRMSIIPEGDHYAYIDKGTIDHDETFALCRCGLTKTAPFCDGAHDPAGFDGAETAQRNTYLERAERIAGDGIDLLDDYDMCALARFCHTDAGTIWDLMEDSHNPEVRARIIKAANECPSGRLVVVDQATGAPIEYEYPDEVIVLDDPEMACGGPLWIRGNFTLIGSDGMAYDKHAKYTLCRCGNSQLKPFCDCAHAHVHWNELVE
jgi:CDGSH-type Zn-finger protein